MRGMAGDKIMKYYPACKELKSLCSCFKQREQEHYCQYLSRGVRGILYLLILFNFNFVFLALIQNVCCSYLFKQPPSQAEIRKIAYLCN